MIKWSSLANNDLAAILRYFTHKGEPLTGDKIVKRLIEAARQLKTSPRSGRIGRISGTRELIVRKLPYILVYINLDEKNTEIFRVMHTSQQWPPEDGRQYH